jgi:hypothetical protein
VVVEQSTRDLEEIQFNPPPSSHCSVTDRAGRFKPAQQKLRSDDETKFNHIDGKMRAERRRGRESHKEWLLGTAYGDRQRERESQ